MEFGRGPGPFFGALLRQGPTQIRGDPDDRTVRRSLPKGLVFPDRGEKRPCIRRVIVPSLDISGFIPVTLAITEERAERFTPDWRGNIRPPAERRRRSRRPDITGQAGAGGITGSARGPKGIAPLSRACRNVHSPDDRGRRKRNAAVRSRPAVG